MRFVQSGILALTVTCALIASGLGPRTLVRAEEPITDPNVFVKLSKKIVPSVVNISTTTKLRGSVRPDSPEEYFRKFFENFWQNGVPGTRPDLGPRDQDSEGNEGDENMGPGDVPRSMSLGTGFIIDSDGLILTNHHVVEGADEINIQFTEDADETPSLGEVVGRDPELDLALIKVKSKREMVPVALGDSDKLEVGEYVMAVGNPFGQGHSVSHGIVSAKERRAPDFQLANYIQTDAPINPGNSGGPLVNLRGEVIGINNAVHRQAQGIGFAIPINLVKKVLPQLKSKGIVSRGYIGVLVSDILPEVAQKLGLPEDIRGPLVTQVTPSEPAAKAGIKPYDVILEFNGKPIRRSADLVTEVTNVAANMSVPMKIWRAEAAGGKTRGGKTLDLTIRTADRSVLQQVAQPENAKRRKKRDQTKRPETGMELEDLTAETARELGMSEKSSGVLVTSVGYGSPADKAGILRGDVILEVDRKPVANVDRFYKIVKGKKSYLLRIRRLDPQGKEGFEVIILDLKA